MSSFDTRNMLDFQFHEDLLPQLHSQYQSLDSCNHNKNEDNESISTESALNWDDHPQHNLNQRRSSQQLSYSRLLLSDILNYDIHAAIEQDHEQTKAKYLHRKSSFNKAPSEDHPPLLIKHKRNDFLIDFEGDEHELGNLVDEERGPSPAESNVNLVSEQSFLTTTSHSAHDELLRIFQDVKEDTPYDAYDDYDNDFDATSSNTVSPESCMNGYMQFVIDSSQVPSTYDFSEAMNSSNRTEDDSLPTSPKQELTHDQVIRLFEETCKEIDEWKSDFESSRVRLHPIRIINGYSSGFNTITNGKFSPGDTGLSPVDETLKASPNHVDNEDKLTPPPLFANDSFDDYDEEPDYTHEVSIPPFIKGSNVKRSSSVSSLRSDQSHLSFNQAQLNISSTSSSPLNNSSGTSTSGKRRNKFKLSSTSSQKSLQKNLFRTSSSIPKIDFSHMSIESIPDVEYSKSLSSKSPKVPSVPHCSQLLDKLIAPLFDDEKCSIQRTLYLRNNFDLIFAQQGPPEYNLSYNINFKKTSYEAQFILTKVDDKYGKPDNTTRAGLCPYCESIEFFGLKNSSYGNHLAYKHGILTNGKSVPDPKYYGLYQFKKGEYDVPEKKRRKTNAHILEREGVLCTDCWQILEVNCTSRSSILGHYLRHYRDSHVGYKKENKFDEEGGFFDDPVVMEFVSQWEQQ
ncbi:hypothetical protein I9W82_004303 [Candida metapsilosis]|uniref:Transcription regulator Rua1 C-terminal domain-containing protein n=1 Tax=Candida metapsilosis TaxID=273372 RepID=A0A8H7ZEI7_9ASCO|nr:hypothetical protein I9W82_004303 [Candida metapsilosis]